MIGAVVHENPYRPRSGRDGRIVLRIWVIGSELPMHAIQWARRGLVARRGFDRLTAHDALQTR